MATLVPISAYVAASGRDIIVKAETATIPANSEVLDWLPGWLAGLGVRLNSGKTLAFLGASHRTDYGKYEAWLHFEITTQAEIFKFGDASDSISFDAGAFSDRFGNSVGAIVNLPVPNFSLAGSDGFASSDVVSPASGATILYVVPVAGVGNDSRTIAQGQNAATPLLSVGRAITLANGASGRFIIKVLEGTTQSVADMALKSGTRLAPTVITSFWGIYGAGVGTQGVRPTFTRTGDQLLSADGKQGILIDGIRFDCANDWRAVFGYQGGGGSDITFWDCKIENGLSQIVLDTNTPGGSLTTTNSWTRFAFLRCQFGQTVNGQGMYLKGTKDMLIRDSVFHHAGEVGLNQGNTLKHAIYAQYLNDPTFTAHNVFSQTGSHALQLRGGGTIVHTLGDKCPIFSEIDHAGGRLAHCWLQRGSRIKPPTDAVRAWGPGTKYTDAASADPDNPFTQYGVLFECYAIVQHFDTGSTNTNGPRALSMSFEGPQLRRGCIARNFTVRRGGAVTFEGGEHPVDKFKMRNALIDNRGQSGGVSECPVHMEPTFPSYAFLDCDFNRYAFSGDFLDRDGARSSFAQWKSASGADANSSQVTPTYVQDLVDLGDWFATIAGGSNDNDAAIAWFFARARKVWSSDYDPQTAISWLRSQQLPTNVADIDATTLGFVGAGTFTGPTYSPSISFPPGTPTNFTATPGNGQILYTWGVQTATTGLTLDWGFTQGGPYPNSVVLDGTATQYLLTGRTNGVPVYAILKASNGVGDSAWTAEVSATPTLPPAPTVNAGPDQTVTDTDRNGSQAVTLAGSVSGQFTTTTWTDPQNGNATVSTSLTPTVTRNLGVQFLDLTAVGPGGTTTDRVQITVNPGTPVVSLSAGVGSFTAGFGLMPNVTALELGWSLTPGGPPYANTSTFAPATQIVGSLNGDAIYYVSARAFANGAWGAWATEQQIRTLAQPANQPPVCVITLDTSPVVDTDRDGSEIVDVSIASSTDPDGTVESGTISVNDGRVPFAITPLGSVPTGFPLGITPITGVVIDDDAKTSNPATVNVEVVPNTPAGLTVNQAGFGELDCSVTAYTGSSGYFWEASVDNFATVAASHSTTAETYRFTGLAAVATKVRCSVKGPNNVGAPCTAVTQTPLATPASPIANAGPDQTVTDTNRNGSESVTLDGSGSTYSNATIAWTEGGSAVSSVIGPTITSSLGVHNYDLGLTNIAGSSTDRVTITVKPNTILGFALTAQIGGFTWAATAHTGVTQYDVAIDTNQNGTYATVFTSGTNAGSVPGLSEGTEYWAKIRGRANGAVGDWSTATNVTTLTSAANTPTANPGADLTVTDTNRNASESISVNMSGSTTPTGTITNYSIFEGGSTVFSSGTPTGSFTAALGQHTYGARVTNSVPLNSPLEPWVVTVKPNTLLNFAATSPAPNRLRVSCDAYSGLSEYRYEISYDNFATVYTATANGSNLEDIYPLPSGTAWVRAKAIAAGEIESDPTAVIQLTIQAPQAVVQWKITDPNGNDYSPDLQPDVTLDQVVDLNGTLRRSWVIQNVGTETIKISTLRMAHPYIQVENPPANFDLEPGQSLEVWFVVSGVSVGDFSVRAEILTTTAGLADIAATVNFSIEDPNPTTDPPDAPTNCHMTGGRGLVYLHIPQVPGATGYRGVFGTTQDTYTQTIDSSTSPIVSTGWPDSTIVYGRAYASNVAGESAASSEVSASTLSDVPVPPRPSWLNELSPRKWTRVARFFKEQWANWVGP